MNTHGSKPGRFGHDAIRTIVTSLFYVGYVTHAESAPLRYER